MTQILNKKVLKRSCSGKIFLLTIFLEALDKGFHEEYNEAKGKLYLFDRTNKYLLSRIKEENYDKV